MLAAGPGHAHEPGPEVRGVKIVVVSDTHGRHEELGTLSGDVLIHCGDVFNGFRRNPAEVAQLDAWFGRQRFSKILCVGGNHDFTLEELAEGSEPPFRNAEVLRDRAVEQSPNRPTSRLGRWASTSSKAGCSEGSTHRCTHLPGSAKPGPPARPDTPPASTGQVFPRHEAVLLLRPGRCSAVGGSPSDC